MIKPSAVVSTWERAVEVPDNAIARRNLVEVGRDPKLIVYLQKTGALRHFYRVDDVQKTIQAAFYKKGEDRWYDFPIRFITSRTGGR